MNIDKINNYILESYHHSSDIVTRKINVKGTDILCIYLESVASDDKISEFLMKEINTYSKNKILTVNLFDKLKNTIPNSHITVESKLEDCFTKLASGFTCIFIDGDKQYITVETKSKLDRGITESTSENIVRGPKDSFTENNSTNLGLIRKRIKDKNLWYDEIKIGRRTNTKVTIAYINGIANEHIVNNIKEKLKKIDIDGIIDSGNIRDFLIQNQSIFPEIKSTERPDLACNSLLEGKIIILVENTPFTLILPITLNDFLHASEDYYQKSSNVSFTRILRYISFLITITIPGLYIALTTFNQEIIPDQLLISLAIQRDGVPFSTVFELVIMITTFEILRESDIRLPSTMGAAISIVGALVLGEAAVSAGIVSPIVIIVVAITSICGLLFTDIDFVNAIRWWRFIFIIFSAAAGLIGFVIATILFINKLASITFDNVCYLAPFSPLYVKSINDSIIKLPNNKLKSRSPYITKNTTKLGDKK